MGDFNEEYDIVIIGTGMLVLLSQHISRADLILPGLTECILSGFVVCSKYDTLSSSLILLIGFSVLRVRKFSTLIRTLTMAGVYSRLSRASQHRAD